MVVAAATVKDRVTIFCSAVRRLVLFSVGLEVDGLHGWTLLGKDAGARPSV